MEKTKELSGLQKVAIFLITLGPELSANVLKNMPQEDIERISYEIANITSISPQVKNLVIDEFLSLNEAQQYLLRGGIKYARELLEKTVGPHKAGEILRKLTESAKIRPFNLVRKTDPRQLASFINNEHPQTIALILSYMDPDQAAVVLSSLTEEVQADIARRIAIMERTSPEILREIESVMDRKLSNLVTQDFTIAGGIQALVQILNSVDRGTEKSILEALEMEDNELADEVRKRMFVFEDLITLDDVSIRRVLREVDMKDLAYALKGASNEVAERLYRNLSKRAADMLREDIELLGPIRLRDVEEAQQRIVQIIRHLDETGEIVLSRGGEDALVL